MVRCDQCGREITDSTYKSRNTGFTTYYYHNYCFTCDKCGRPLSGTYLFVPSTSGKYHMGCKPANVQAETCQIL